MIHVVVVEDDQDIGFLLMNLLGREDSISAVHLTTAEAAMTEDVWRFNEGSKVVGLLDIMLPDTTGVEIAAWVRQHFPDIPIIGLTALPEDDELFQTMNGVADLVLSKPVVPRVLVEQIMHLAVGSDGSQVGR